MNVVIIFVVAEGKSCGWCCAGAVPDWLNGWLDGKPSLATKRVVVCFLFFSSLSLALPLLVSFSLAYIYIYIYRDIYFLLFVLCFFWLLLIVVVAVVVVVVDAELVKQASDKKEGREARLA